MPDKKSLPKERYVRQRKARELRRSIAAITPENSQPQKQSPLFSILPAEIRLLIFQNVLSQQLDLYRRIDIHSISPLYRPGHTYRTTVDIVLLLTCRLIYFEAHDIPLRSATHHFRYLGSTSWLYNGDVWLHHITKQRGAELYHLHDNLVALRSHNFSKFLLPHLHWRRITWTVCAYLLPPLLAGQKELDSLVSTLAGLSIPWSCREVTLELETREDLRDDQPSFSVQANACREIALTRSKGTKLDFDEKYSAQYKWVGSWQARWGTSETALAENTMLYCTTRLCWREKVARREYMSYDYLDCLRLEGCAQVVKVLPMENGSQIFKELAD
ncbi:hypothetical protein BKA66DRAFT_475630 [Pyrenochaeta sp. MPI-SDFR-AT-0127]|nr:hypothetical protein BKA66DRAFT_475630 [Pyrenochaeta sp. MPI-SDFR-AT-0127]